MQGWCAVIDVARWPGARLVGLLELVTSLVTRPATDLPVPGHIAGQLASSCFILATSQSISTADRVSDQRQSICNSGYFPADWATAHGPWTCQSVCDWFRLALVRPVRFCSRLMFWCSPLANETDWSCCRHCLSLHQYSGQVLAIRIGTHNVFS